MAGAKPELRPRVFQNQARDLLRHVRKGQADHAEVVDALRSMAREHGLLELLGQDKVQAIVSGAEDDPKPAPPPEANGAWPGMFEQPGDPGPAAPSETPHGPPQPLAPWWRDPATIPPRRYLFGGHYVRLAVGVTIGAGGRAKTTLGCCEAVGMAVGRDLMIDKPLPDGPLRVWMLNSEEDQDELDRRISAVCQRYEISEADLGGRLYAQSVRDKPMRIAAMVGGVPMLDANVVQQMTAFAKENRIDVVMADPLVSFHSVPENDNGAMDIVIKGGFGSIANQANAAVELFHHPGFPPPG
jgi:AAA domain